MKTVVDVSHRIETAATVIAAASGVYEAAHAIAVHWPEIANFVSHFVNFADEDGHWSQRDWRRGTGVEEGIGSNGFEHVERRPDSERPEVKRAASLQQSVKALQDAETREEFRKAAFALASGLDEYLLAAYALQTRPNTSGSEHRNRPGEPPQAEYVRGYYQHLLTTERKFEREIELADPEFHAKLAEMLPHYACGPDGRKLNAQD